MRSGRSALNFGTGALYTAVTLAAALVATPLLLGWLGEERFGAYRAASEWWGYLALIELGTGGALRALLAEADGRRHAQLTRELLVAGVRRYGAIALATVLLGLLLAIAIPHLVPVRAALRPDLRLGWLIGLLGIVTLPITGPYRTLVESQQRGYWLNGLLIVQGLVTTGVALLLAWMGWGIRGQFIALLAGSVPFSLALAWHARTAHPGVVRAAVAGPAAPDVARRLRRLNAPTLVVDVCGRVGLMSDSIVLALVLGPAAIVPVFATQRLAVLAQGQLQGVGNASWAALAELHHQGQTTIFNQRVVQLTRMVAVLGAAVLVPIAVYAAPFVTLWVGAERFAGHAVSVVAAVNAYLLGILSLWSWCLAGTGKVERLVRPAVGQALVNVPLSIVLTRLLGPIGPLLGTLVAMVCVSLWVIPRRMQQEFGTPVRALYRAAALPAAVGAPYAAALWWVGSRHAPIGWVGLGLHFALAAGVVPAFWWLVMLRGTERSALRAQAGSMWPRRPAT